MDIVRVFLSLFGLLLIGWTLLSTLRTVVLARGAKVRLTQFIFRLIGRGFFFPIARRLRNFERRDHWLAIFAPVTLMVLPIVWLSLVHLGFTLIYWSYGGLNWQEAFTISGSSILTLGFAAPKNFGQTLICFVEATLGLGILSLLIAYLPSLYAAFARRERIVTRLGRRVESPPSALRMFEHFHSIGGLDLITEIIWVEWEDWFADLEESHTSFPALVFFRSPALRRSWITAAGAVLDAASLAVSCMKKHDSPAAKLTLITGYHALRAIAEVLELKFNHNPRPGDPISVTRAEFNEVYNRMKEIGIELKPDRDKAWKVFVDCRVEYDQVLNAISLLLLAPYAPWSSDRLPVGEASNQT